MNKYATNPLRTRGDLVRLAADMIESLLPCLSPGRARLHIGDTGAVYDEAIAGMEGFSGCCGRWRGFSRAAAR